MENKYKIIISYIQDLSVEIPSPESLLTIRNTIPEFQIKVDINFFYSITTPKYVL